MCQRAYSRTLLSQTTYPLFLVLSLPCFLEHNDNIILRSWRGQRCGDGEPLPLGAKASTSEWGRPTNRPPFPTNKGKGEEFYQTTAYRKERRAACAEGQTRGNERRLPLRRRSMERLRSQNDYKFSIPLRIERRSLVVPRSIKKYWAKVWLP